MTSDPLITFRRKPGTLDLSAIETFAELLRKRVAGGAEFHCLITGDSELRKMNLDFRGKDYATDVLSFPGEAEDLADADYLGDIAISLGRARSQAKRYGHSAEQELCILMLHGLLHLKGMDHEADNGQMARAESRWRGLLELPKGLIARSS